MFLPKTSAICHSRVNFHPARIVFSLQSSFFSQMCFLLHATYQQLLEMKITVVPNHILFSLILSLSLSITVAQEKEAHFQKDSANVLDEVVVTGQYTPQALKKSVFQVRVINSDRIRQQGATDVLAVLNTETGIRFSTDYTLGETNLNFMGMSGQNVKILLDGIPLVDRDNVRQSLSQIDINSIEKIEIVEGPMSVVYGTDALAGVINIITKKPKSNDGFKVTARLQEETSGSVYSPFTGDGLHHQHLSVSYGKNNWATTGYFSRNAFGGWTGNAAFRAREAKPKDQYIGGLTIGYRTPKSITWYRLDYLNEDIYVAGALNPNNFRAKDQHYYTDRFTHQLQNDWKINAGFRLNSSFSFQDYKRKTETYTMDYVTGSKTYGTGAGEQDLSTFQSWFFRTTGQLALSDKISLQPGLEVKSDNTSGERVAGTPSITDYSLFISAELKPIKPLNIRPGIRFSKNSNYGAPPIIPSVNAKLDIDSKTSWRISYARGFRAPILRELYFNYFDANHSIEGNPNLKAETSNSFQTSVTRNWKQTNDLAFNSNLTGFYNSFHNRITLSAAPNNIFTYFNVERFKTTGIEVENNFKYKNLSLTLGLSYIGRYNLYRDDAAFASNDLPEFLWSPEVNSNISYSFPKLKTTINLYYKYTGKLPRYATELNTTTGKEEVYLTSLAAYHWADVTVSKDLLKFFTLQAGIKNLFDVVRIDNQVEGSGSVHTTSGPVLTGFGRSYFIGLSFQLK